MQNQHYNNALALDIGDKRIGVARGSSFARIAEGLTTIEVDGRQLDRLRELVVEHNCDLLVVGLPRNQSGELTEQSKKVMAVAEELAEELELPFEYQDESLTSVQAEKMLAQSEKNYEKSDIDRESARLILQDFLDRTNLET